MQPRGACVGECPAFSRARRFSQYRFECSLFHALARSYQKMESNRGPSATACAHGLC